MSIVFFINTNIYARIVIIFQKEPRHFTVMSGFFSLSEFYECLFLYARHVAAAYSKHPCNLSLRKWLCSAKAIPKPYNFTVAVVERGFDAVIEGVDGYGYLLLRRSNGTLSRYAFKEVELLL